MCTRSDTMWRCTSATSPPLEQPRARPLRQGHPLHCHPVLAPLDPVAATSTRQRAGPHLLVGGPRWAAPNAAGELEVRVRGEVEGAASRPLAGGSGDQVADVCHRAARASAIGGAHAAGSSGDGEASRWIRLLGADPPPPLPVRGRRHALASDPPSGGAPRAASSNPPPRLLT